MPRLQRLLEAVPLPALLVDGQERIVVVNTAAAHLLGAATLGRLYPTALRQAGVQGAIEAALHRGEGGQARHVVQDGASETVYRVSVTAIEEGALCVFEDVSEPEQIAQMRRDFVANVSHELRTPLTALLGFIETLQGAARDDPAARDRFLAVMAREAGRMNRLVGDLLSLSRVEAQERIRPTERVDIAGLIRRVLSDLRPVAAAAGVTLNPSGLDREVFLRGDADQLTQVLTNLIENAVKYGAAGKTVHVSLSRAEREQGLRGPAFRIAVRDEGEGIDAIHLPRLTERFYRVDSHRSREKGGTGLGLAIVKHILNRHRGRLRIESEQGRGSTFTVILPDEEPGPAAGAV
ncbi:MAG: sensor histidine kinase [Pseudorhodobacter sp.]